MREASLRKHQQGFTLVELLIASAISLVAVSGMVIVMSTTLGASADVINNTRLSGDLRAAMQIVSRELRRANYRGSFALCIGSGDTGAGNCLQVNDVAGGLEVTNNCVGYSYERNSLPVSGAVRLNAGALEFGDNVTCTSNAGDWDQITDPDQVTVTAFTLTNTDGNALTYESEASVGLTQRVRKVRILMTATACPVGETCANAPARTVTSTVRVRNDIIFPTPPPAT